MAYDYIQRAYGKQPIIGEVVRHLVTNEFGKVAREYPRDAHYVQVRFEGKNFSLPCHPDELEYLGKDAAASDAQRGLNNRDEP